MPSLRLATSRDGRLGARASLLSNDRTVAKASAAITDLVHVSVTIDADEPSIRFSAAVGAYLSLTIPISHRLREQLSALVLRGIDHKNYDDADVIRVSLCGGRVTWSIGHTPEAWHHTTPRWRSGSWDVVSAVLGEPKYSDEVLGVHEVAVPMHEGFYMWRVTLKKTTGGRKRWPWSAPIYRFEAECLDGQQIGHPGKGESAHDCGDDATYALSAPGRTLDEAVTKIVGAVLRSRLRYGGKLTFTPSPKAA
jgi:hypothetical protein